MRPSTFSIWLAAARPRTLPAAVAPVAVGTAMAWREGRFVAPAALGCLAFALLIQIGTNFANDYYDFIKGADGPARVGPRRAVAAGLVSPAAMRRAMWAAFAAAIGAGLTLLPYGGWPLIAVGVASLVCGLAYTGGPWPLGYHGLGDIFVFVFFGLVAVSVTHFTQAGRLSAGSLAAGAGVGALAANILLVNNYRDLETDAVAGKRTLVVRFGRRAARLQFGLCHAIALAVPPLLAWKHPERLASAGMVSGALAVLAARQIAALRRARAPEELIALLGRAAAHLAVYAGALSLWLVIP